MGPPVIYVFCFCGLWPIGGLQPAQNPSEAIGADKRDKLQLNFPRVCQSPAAGAASLSRLLLGAVCPPWIPRGLSMARRGS